MRSGQSARLSSLSRISDFPRMEAVYVGTVRSPVSRGSITSMSLPHLPRGYRSITADDIPGAKDISSQGAGIPVLASGRVSYRGQPVALIVGPERRKVADAISLSVVRVDEEAADYSFETAESARVVKSMRFDSGDVDAALAASAHIVEGDYLMGPQDHYYPEPQGSAAAFDYDKLVIYSSTQWPFHVRASVASTLGVKPEELIVHTTLLGPHLDGKLWYPSLLACHAGLAAVLCGRPALLLLSREEDFLYTTKRAPTSASYRAGLDAEGRLLALDAAIMVNMGAYAPFVDTLTSRALGVAAGAYSCPNVRIAARAVSTDLPPMGAFAGMGTGPVTFAVERLAEDCASALDMDPSEWRSINVASKGDRTMGNALKHPIPYQALSSNLLAASDYPRKRSSFELIRKRRADPSLAPGFGIGLAFGGQMPAGDFGRSGSVSPTVELTLSKDSTLTIRTSSLPCSEKAIEILKHSAAQALGIQVKSVILESSGTDSAPDTGPSVLSRNISVVSRLVNAACEGLRTKRFREALPITVRKSQRTRNRRSAPESPLDESAWGGAVVELELDQVDAYPMVRGIWLAAKAGRILSAEEARRTLEHDAIIALGLCMGETLDLSGGPAGVEDLRRYRLSRIKDAPPVHVEFIDDDTDPKGIGELAYALVPPAFANALSQALDSQWNTLPTGLASQKGGGT